MLKNKQSTRSLTAFLVTWAFLILTVSGIVLYIVPQGRIAYWVHWSLLGLGKTQWGNLHMVFGGLFIATGILHLYFNWKPFKKYLADRVSGHLQIKRELLLSLLISLLILVGAVANLPPVSWVFDLNEQVKDSWVSSPELEPPFGHAEAISLAALARRTNLDLNKALAELAARGIRLNGKQDTLEQIARGNGTTPMAIWQHSRHFETEPPVQSEAPMTALDVEAKYAGSGIGRKTVAEVAQSVGIDPGLAHQRLRTAGLQAGEDEQLKTLAEQLGLEPMDLLKTMLVPGYDPASGSAGGD